jgi:2-polyprenyl-6-methoxyphenol hydroxylase-like FAD-dependent oxidoreductase
MLLARMGHRVLVVDRATFPSDTVSTHVLQPRAVEALARWGLLDRLTATGCPPVHTFAMDFGPVTLTGSPGTAAAPFAYCPRRTVLDKLLVDAAVEAGAEVREGFTVSRLLMEDGRVVGIEGHGKSGATVTERAPVVIGADGVHSLVARTVNPEEYNRKPTLQAAYYTYYSDLPMDGRFEVYIRPGRGVAAMPTHDGLTLVLVGWPFAEFEANKKDVEGNFDRTIALHPAFAARLRAARRAERFAGATIPNFFRKPHGPGWALVGDAGYTKDPITAQGISDAFHDAEGLAAALHHVFGGDRPFDDAMAAYQRARDERVLPMYELTVQAAMLQPPPPEMQQLMGAIAGNQEATDAFMRVNAGTMPPGEFFAPENIGRIMASRDRVPDRPAQPAAPR